MIPRLPLLPDRDGPGASLADDAAARAEVRIAQVEDELAALRQVTSLMSSQLRNADAAYAAVARDLAATQRTVAAERNERQDLLVSTSWRVTAPLRRLTAAMPPGAKRQARRAAKVALWAATPWRLPARLRLLAARREAAMLAAAPPPPALAPPPDQAPTHPPTLDGSGIVIDGYARWIAAFEPPGPAGPAAPAALQVSLLLTGAGDPEALAATLSALPAQARVTWDLLLPDDAAGQACAALLPEGQAALVPGAGGADRGATLAALLAAAKAEWVMVLDPGDVLLPWAFSQLADTLAAHPGAAGAYGDEDVREPEGRRTLPQLKPAWSPELLHAYNYPGRPMLVSRALAVAAGGFAPGDGAAAEWGLNLRLGDAAAAAGRPLLRVPAVLCHRRPASHRDRPAPDTPAAADHRRMLRTYWERQGRTGVVVATQPDGTQRSTWTLPEPPLVSIVIPNRDSPALLRRCLHGLQRGTDYANVEIVVVDNGSEHPETLAIYETLRAGGRDKVLERPAAFNYSAACNLGARAARGTLLLFLNNDVEIVEPGWLTELVRMAGLPGVGVVGAKLRYSYGSLQHAGVGVGPHLFGLMFHRSDESHWGVFGSPNHTRNWSAVMGACQMVRADAFRQLGGFDEAYEIANSDVLLSLRAAQLGYRTAYTPFAVLVHHEGTTRGARSPASDMARAARELRRLAFVEDPCLHPALAGDDPVPNLRAPADPSCRTTLETHSARFIAAVPPHDAGLDLFDDAAMLAAVALPRAMMLLPWRAADPVADEWAAAAWVIELLRRRPGLRLRFPRALSEGESGSFAAWLAEEAEHEVALPPGLRDHLPSMWRLDPGSRPRKAFFWREDVRGAHPAGLLPPGRRGLATWLFRDGMREHELRREEVWWCLLSCAEDPAAELVLTYRFTPAWQEAHPLGLTAFGQAAFAAWVAARFEVAADSIWLQPGPWPGLPGPAEQLRLAYASHPAWQARHPAAFRDAAAAAALLAWLATPDSGQPREVRAWVAAQAEAGLATPMAALAVNVIGHFCYASGLRVSVEAMSDAMEQVGVAVARRNLRTQPSEDPRHGAFGGLEGADVTIIHTQPEPFFEHCYERGDLVARPRRTFRIGYWYWELDLVPADWARVARQADEIWTASGFVADALRRVVDVPVRVMFPGVRLVPFTRRPRERLGAPARGAGRFAFLFSFHMASVTERKNPLGLIRAFRLAFEAHEPVDLVLKTTWEPVHAAQLEALREAAGEANVTVISRVFTPDETLSLVDACDAYVSLHRAEGLGLTMAEAMLLGKPVIASRYSGNLEFMDDDNSLLVNCTVEKLGRSIPPYDAAARWAKPSELHAAQLMRRLYDDRTFAAELGRKAQDSARRTMSLDVAGQRMAARLREIRG